MSITCGSNEVIKVKEAWYGRKSTTVCQYAACQHVHNCAFMKQTSCSTDPEISLQKVKGLCHLKMSCKIKPNSTMFGDPCEGTYKYLSLSYQCEQGKHVRAIWKNGMLLGIFKYLCFKNI